MAINTKPRSHSRRSGGVFLLIGVLVGATVVGGVGVIAASTTKSVTVCANKKTNILRYAKSGKCVTKTETKVILNQTVDVVGAPGTAGEKGADGTAGAKGADGTAGTKGADGTAGAKGADGTAGAKGDAGDAGVGTKGDTGAAGTNGANTNSQVKHLCGTNGTTVCAVGLRGPGGGIVFMTPSTLGNTSGLFYEAAPATWHSSSGDPQSAWCDNTTTALGAVTTDAGIGAMDGAAKTSVMLGVCTSGAANLADVYTSTVNGVVYGDWFLPSKGELNQIYVNRIAIGDFASDYYWSSSEAAGNSAWFQFFPFGNQVSYNKGDALYVRPVRAF